MDKTNLIPTRRASKSYVFYEILRFQNWKSIVWASSKFYWSMNHRISFGKFFQKSDRRLRVWTQIFLNPWTSGDFLAWGNKSRRTISVARYSSKDKTISVVTSVDAKIERSSNFFKQIQKQVNFLLLTTSKHTFDSLCCLSSLWVGLVFVGYLNWDQKPSVFSQPSDIVYFHL